MVAYSFMVKVPFNAIVLVTTNAAVFSSKAYH